MNGFGRMAMRNAQAREEAGQEAGLPPMRFLNGPDYDPPPPSRTWETVAKSWEKAAKAWGRVERMLQ